MYKSYLVTIVLIQLRILFLTQVFSSTEGGAPLIFYDLANALAKKGHKVFVICNVSTDDLDSDEIKVFIVKPFLSNVFELPPSPLGNMRYLLNSIMLGIKIVRKNRIELIHTNSFTPVIAGSILSKICHRPMVASIHDIFTESNKNNWKKWVIQRNLPSYYSTLGKIYENVSLSMPFEVIHAISESTRRDILIQKPNRKIRVIYPAINSSLDSTGRSYENFILYIGRLVFYKNVDLLIRAYENVTRKNPSAKLIVVGEGPMEANWKKLAVSLGISENIIFTGHVPHEKKVELLNTCSALALPSSFEGFGLVILEAFAMQKPVLVPNSPPFDEIVTQDHDGFLLNPYDVQQWSDAIVSILTNKELSRRMGCNAAKKFEERFEFMHYVKAIESLYQEIVGDATKQK